MKTNGRRERELNGVIELTRDEIIERIERGARRRLRTSAKDLVRRYRTGKLQDPGSVADLLALANLLPDDDPLFGSAVAIIDLSALLKSYKGKWVVISEDKTRVLCSADSLEEAIKGSDKCKDHSILLRVTDEHTAHLL